MTDAHTLMAGYRQQVEDGHDLAGRLLDDPHWDDDAWTATAGGAVLAWYRDHLPLWVGIAAFHPGIDTGPPPPGPQSSREAVDHLHARCEALLDAWPADDDEPTGDGTVRLLRRPDAIS